MYRGRPYFVLFLLCAFCLCLCFSAYGTDGSDLLQDSASEGESSESVYDEPSSSDEPEPAEEGGSSEEGSEVEDSGPEGSVSIISDDQYRSYVIGFLMFFTVVIICYFAFKFFSMFF